MGSENAPAAIAFASAAEADRRIAGVAAAGRAVRAAVEAGAQAVRLRLGDGAALAPATLTDLERLRGRANVAIEAGAVERSESLPSSWAVIRATGKSGDGPVSRWLNRPISQRITWLVLTFPGVRPIHATAATALLALAMAASLLSGGAAGLILGGVLFQAASVVDGVDGEIARTTWRSSAAGAALDSAVDLVTNFLFIFCLTVALALRDGPWIAWVGGCGLVLFAIGAALIGWNGRRVGASLGFELVKQHTARRAGSPRAALAKAATIVSSRDFFALLFMTLILAGLERAIPYIFASAAIVWIPVVVGTILAGPGRSPGGEAPCRGAA